MSREEQGAPIYSTVEDEISLRDLYLIIRRGLPIILIVALAAGAAAYLVSSLLPPVYEAQSSTVVTPSSLSVTDPGGLSFNPNSSISFESYRTLALSQPVMIATLDQLGSTDLDPEELRQKADVRQLVGPKTAETAQSVSLIVSQSLRLSDPQRAAEVTNAWTEQTLLTIRNSILNSLNPVAQVNRTQLLQAEQRLETSEEAFFAFEAKHNLKLMTSRAEQLNTRVTDNEFKLIELRDDHALAQERLETLNEQLALMRRALYTPDPQSTEFLAGLTLSEAKSFVDGQLTRLERERIQATSSLTEFEAQYDLALLQGRVDRLTSVVTESEARLAALPSERAILGARLRELEVQLAEQPERLTVVQNMMVDGLSTPVETEVLNPVRTEMLGELISLRAEVEGLDVEQGRLSEALDNDLSLLEDLRQTLVRLKPQYEELLTLAATIEGGYQALKTWRQQLELAGTRADAETIRFRASSQDLSEDPLLQLEQNVRAEELTVRGLAAQITRLESQAEEEGLRAAEIQQELAVLQLERDRLEQELNEARDAYAELTKLQPLTSYITELAPASAQVLSAASAPTKPVGPRTLLNTALATVLGGMMALLFVFVREAVRDPEETSVKARSQVAMKQVVPSTGG